MKKHIVIVTSYYAPAWAYGGPPIVLSTLARDLVKKNYNVSVITTDALDEYRNKTLEEQMDGVQIYRYPTISNTLAYRYKLFYSPTAKKASNLLLTAHYVLFSDLRSLFNWQLYPLVSQHKIPYGIFPFGQIPYDHSTKGIIKRFFDRLWVKDFVSRATWRFAQTDHEREMFSTYFSISKEKTDLLYLPVHDDVAQASKKEIDRFRGMWNIKKSDKVLLYVGRLHYLKGVDLLIEAAIPLVRDNRSIKLLIVGRDDGELGRLTSIIPQDCQDNIVFTGGLYGKDVAPAYQMATCFTITPRFYEETSLAALTALSYREPVVTTFESEIPRLDESQAGITVQSTQQDIRKGLWKILRMSTAQRQKMKQAAKNLVNDTFDARKITDKLLDIMKT